MWYGTHRMGHRCCGVGCTLQLLRAYPHLRHCVVVVMAKMAMIRTMVLVGVDGMMSWFG